MTQVPPPKTENGSAITPATSSPPATSAGKVLLWSGAGALGCLLMLVALVFFSALAVAGTLNGGVRLMNQTLTNLFDPPPPSARVATSETIVNRIQPLGQLVSTSAQVAKADIAVNIQQGAFAMCNHSANHVASATIEAGIDLYQIDSTAVQYDQITDTYTLRIPRPTITNCYVDFIDQYDRRQSGPTCTVDWDDARQIAQYEALVAFREDAIEGGLLVTAERDTQLALSSFITALTGSQVVIEFTDEATAQAEGCAPTPPRDWQQVDGEWVRIR